MDSEQSRGSRGSHSLHGMKKLPGKEEIELEPEFGTRIQNLMPPVVAKTQQTKDKPDRIENHEVMSRLSALPGLAFYLERKCTSCWMGIVSQRVLLTLFAVHRARASRGRARNTVLQPCGWVLFTPLGLPRWRHGMPGLRHWREGWAAGS